MFRIGIFIYHNVEVLDFCGPFEVFNSAVYFAKNLVEMEVITVAPTENIIDAQGLRVTPDYSINNCPTLDILLIPGGATLPVADNQEVVDWIRDLEPKLNHLLTVCTGSLLLAKLNLLDNKKATTHHGSIKRLRELAPEAVIDVSKRFIDNGKIVTAAGISAGIDMSLYICKKLWGEGIATKIANYMEYNWNNSDENFLDTELYS